MKQILFSLTAILLLSIAACKKDEKTVQCRLVGRAGLVDSAHLTYDAQGRVLTYELVGESVYTFTYTSTLTAKCVVSTLTDSNYTTYRIFLNSNGTVSSMNNSVLESGTTYTYNYSFIYNADNRIIRCDQRAEGPGSAIIKKDSMVYENGSLAKQYTYYATSPTGPYTLQEYAITTSTDIPNQIGYHAFSVYEEPMTLLIGSFQFYHLLGKGSDKLPTETNSYNPDGTLSFRVNYNYSFDENGFITEQNVSRSILSPSTGNRRFHYYCE